MELLFNRQKASYELDKGALEGTINILRGQLQQKQKEGQVFGSLLEKLQDIENEAKATLSPPQTEDCRPFFGPEKILEELGQKIKDQSTKLLDFVSIDDGGKMDEASQAIYDFVDLVMQQLATITQELNKEREKNIKLTERLEIELENEDTLLSTMESLEKQISQISSGSRSHGFSFLADTQEINEVT